MSSFKTFLHSGHGPTLFASFLYFSFSCCIWVLNGAMAPFIGESFDLSPAQKGLMLSVPIIAGALMRFPLGILSQYIGRKNATLVEMGLIAVAMLFGFFFVKSFNDLLAMGVLLGIAGASFGVALSLGSGWFPPQHKGLAMGLVGAGNVGTAVSVLVAPPLAQWLGWQAVYGVAAGAILVPMIVMIVFAKEPPDVDSHASFREHIACLFEKDGWVFSLIYGVTFGGFIGLTTFLPSYYYDQFGVSKVQAGQLTMLAAFMGAAVRIVGGWISDRWGGVNTLTVVLLVVALGLVLVGISSASLALTTLLLIVCFAALGAGNGALFQLVPLRWPTSTAVAGSMIGEIGALGGGLVPNAMGLSKQYLGSYVWGFVFFGALSLVMLGVMRVMQIRWTRTWAEKGGRARTTAFSSQANFASGEVKRGARP
ncbi:NNP family nitrate/nitrite transporter-like MFS transporter [Variovorax beijingensis]|uniref:NNP family nitrate/nitrite transporter-like MFS transporter n=2 Tax=Variovorax TaxID=34072 RepID=A0AAE3Y6J3_VARPD|nr:MULTISPECIES: MFS transporter [Variovorax]MBD9668315.1 NarK/NasA family nitrate transporter [Variovorax sp. VRV01]MDP9968385.1 NNP family nitrate/nitrite transporter-like MFS transporter [Variovorax paradoxus]MDR6430091.1 NNP family nitrate/nitrite transporter-like MFS transporter [Variovorax paradoxus]MDR6456720.1 NNP family nitrate/nitrite transporter-like MFS transporter [Variovorax paradoxus]TWD74625.1 NNP family nitrate/nitrite transporter-like MFS transporter [Variovorax beijingensis]